METNNAVLSDTVKGVVAGVTPSKRGKTLFEVVFDDDDGREVSRLFETGLVVRPPLYNGEYVRVVAKPMLNTDEPALAKRIEVLNRITDELIVAYGRIT